ncbi:MAG: hypothetical protein K9J85_11035 [Desulfobacteraceae bacterium]|nr:hypothetical protein [Desulfobacteraceae bacterium]
MVLDEPNESDEEFKVNGFSFIANKDFLAQASPIKIDFNGFGFAISSGMQMDSGCSSCGTDSGACGC